MTAMTIVSGSCSAEEVRGKLSRLSGFGRGLRQGRDAATGQGETPEGEH